MSHLDFLAEGNICGQTLLRLVSRGSAIIAELLRLTDHIPSILLIDETSNTNASNTSSPSSSFSTAITVDPTMLKYLPILYDFRYLKTPEMFDKQLNTSIELSELDDEFYETHEEVLTRFYRLFESIYTYIMDYNRYLSELIEGFYIQHTLEAVLLDTSGRQLLCEGLYLMGVMLLLMDMKVSGPVRERMIVAQYRHKGEGNVSIVELSKLTRDSGYRFNNPNAKRPANYPEEYLARFPIPPKIVNMIIGRLRSDDVYNQARIYPAPEHRSVALAQQASMLYIILYFSPKTLMEAKPVMREIVDKHFSDNWIVPVYMGITIDLSIEWERYKAAKEALAMDTLVINHVKDIMKTHLTSMNEVHKSLDTYLTEGVLVEAYVVDTLAPLMETVRAANIALRWILLHRRCENKKWKELIYTVFSDRKTILNFLLRTSLLEYRLKVHIKHLLAVKASRWSENREDTTKIMTELSQYFSGSGALTRVEKDEGLMNWFASLANEIKALDYTDGVLAGRKIRQLIKALEDVTA